MSPSIYHVATPNSWKMLFNAEWQLLPGLKPWLLGEKVGSKIASSISLITSCTNLSLGGAIVNGLFFPLGLGISTLLPAEKRKELSFNLAMMPSITSPDIPSRVVGTIPLVIFPGLLLILLYANSYILGSNIILYNGSAMYAPGFFLQYSASLRSFLAESDSTVPDLPAALLRHLMFQLGILPQIDPFIR